MRFPTITASLFIISICHMAVAAPPQKGHGSFQAITAPAARKSEPTSPRNYVLFESGQVRPLAVSPDGQRLYAVNTPDSRLEIFAINEFGLIHLNSVPVGLEPVAVAVTPSGEQAWVVNHVSDSISIVQLNNPQPQVIQTLWVGDEPRDIVFAGTDQIRAFVTTAHRGQNSPVSPQLERPGTGRADIWVFDADQTSQTVSGEPVTILTLFGDTPRALAVSNDRQRVYAGVFHSGNQTMTLPPQQVPASAKVPPTTSADGVTQPHAGLIVRFNGFAWVDERNFSWNNQVAISLPDWDVFEIDASASEPTQTRQFSGVGTTIFNMAVNPVTDELYVTNTEAFNQIRFAGVPSRAQTSVRGRLADNRITMIATDGTIHQQRLNTHLEFTEDQATEDIRNLSVSTPMGLAVSSDGQQVYMTAFGSQKLVRYTAEEIRSGTVSPSLSSQIDLSAGGPSGVVLDEQYNRAYVLTRFDNGISVIDLTNNTELSHLKMHNPEPAHIVEGRPFLYDAKRTSGFGNNSCATCHVFGNVDALAWDLGDPEGSVAGIPNEYHPLTANNPGLGFTFHPMKGPMTTQSMRGLRNHGPMHWRGDRTGTDRLPGQTLEEAAFTEFNEAFDALLARPEGLTDEEMAQFTAFTMELTYPPNPLRGLANDLDPVQERGRQLYNNGVIRGDNGIREICVTCHTLDPAAGFFGTTGLMAFNNQPGEKDFKIPHFRDQYQKVGSFGPALNDPFIRGPQIRGFGFNHNGATSSSNILDDLRLPRDQLTALRSYLYAFPTESPPILGQQITVSPANLNEASTRLSLVVQRGQVTQPIPECDLSVDGIVDGKQRSWLMDREGVFNPDDGSAPVTRDALDAIVIGSEATLTYTCTPWGSGNRIALDRDQDGVNDAQEVTQGSDPANAESNTFTPESGLWYNAARSGHGFDLSKVGDRMVITWFTYTDDENPTWYQASGPIGVSWTQELLRFQWQDGVPVAETVGSLNIEFEDALHAMLSWQLGEQSGSEPIERLVFNTAPTGRPFTGLWYFEQEPGWGVSIDSQGEVVVTVLYFYDQSGQPRWVLGQANNAIATSISTQAFTGFCPSCETTSPDGQASGLIDLSFDSLISGQATIDINVPFIENSPWLRESIELIQFSDPVF